jgi:hypothetical protein
VNLVSVTAFSVDGSVVGASLSACVALLAAALIVLSLVNIRDDGAVFSLTADRARSRAAGVVRLMQATIWSSGAGAAMGLLALAWPQVAVRGAAFALACVAVLSFLAMAIRTVSAVASTQRGGR